MMGRHTLLYRQPPDPLFRIIKSCLESIALVPIEALRVPFNHLSVVGFSRNA